MKKSPKWVWDSTRLKKLIDISGCSARTISEVTGLSDATIAHIVSGEARPGIDTIINLSELFAVPIDYLIGRSNEEQNEKLFEQYSECYPDLRRKEYETLLLRRHSREIIPDGYEGPYPYNLLDDIFQEPFDHIITEDEESGLNFALQTLTEREKDVIKELYFEGKTLGDIGIRHNVTRERIRQIASKALRALRHPSRKNLIRYGKTKMDKMVELNKLEIELQNREKELLIKEVTLNKMAEAIEDKKEFIEKNVPEVNFSAANYDAPIPSLRGDWLTPSAAFMDLDLSVRSYNCLVRANIITISDLIHSISTKKIYKVRNLGRRSLEEIINKLQETTGMNLSELIEEEWIKAE